MRRAARVDANHSDVVAALRKDGALVIDTSGVGGGFPDLVVAYYGITALVEVKDGNKSASRQKLTDAQLKFHGQWIGGILCVVDGQESALRVLRVMKNASKQ